MNAGMKMLVSRTVGGAALILGGLFNQAAAETITYIHTDALGSPVAETDAAGSVIRRTTYEPYGAVVGGSVADGPGYAGHVSDASTGLSYMQQRYMDPILVCSLVWIRCRPKAIRWEHSDATGMPIRTHIATLIPMAGEHVAKTLTASWSRGIRWFFCRSRNDGHGAGKQAVNFGVTKLRSLSAID